MSKKEDFEKKYGDYLKKAERAMEVLVRDSEEHAADREKYTMESKKMPDLSCMSREIYYELRLHLTSVQLLKVVKALEPSNITEEK
ncbi:MAG: hypothetical protein V3U54_13485 [Thermodesulfobacteriota bacterium]